MHIVLVPRGEISTCVNDLTEFTWYFSYRWFCKHVYSKTIQNNIQQRSIMINWAFLELGKPTGQLEDNPWVMLSWEMRNVHNLHSLLDDTGTGWDWYSAKQSYPLRARALPSESSVRIHSKTPPTWRSVADAIDRLERAMAALLWHCNTLRPRTLVERWRSGAVSAIVAVRAFGELPWAMTSHDKPWQAMTIT